MVERNRHAATGRFRAPRQREQSRGLPQVYGGRARRSIRDIYEVDHAHGGRNKFRWLVSTCLAASVGTVAIGTVLYGSLTRTDANTSIIDQLTRTQDAPPTPLRLSLIEGGLNWALPKSNRLFLASSALTARYTIHEQVQVRRNNRPFIQIRPYVRISMRLVPASRANRDVIPPFNPLKLYAASAIDEGRTDESAVANRQGRVETKVVELLGGILPGHDGQELDAEEVKALVGEVSGAEVATAQPPSLDKIGVLPGNLTPAYLTRGGDAEDGQARLAEATTVLLRTVRTRAEETAMSTSEIRVVRIGKPVELSDILKEMGAPNWESLAMVDAATSILLESLLPSGNEVRVRLGLHNDRLEPAALAVFGPLNQHLVTVQRSEDGVFVADRAFDPRIFMTTTSFEEAAANDASLYASIYDALLSQGLAPPDILGIMRIYAYELDFRQRVEDGDMLELFFDLKQGGDGASKLGELLYSAITTGGLKVKFWRFRSQDGAVEYYDEIGENSKKFLMRKPVRGDNVRLTSGFGFRRHPVRNVQRMHTGTDWSAPTGTPILAAGRGIIEVAKRNGAYGNYVRIKHSNGYQTAYAHMQRLKSGIEEGKQIRQGQIIGFVGSTGLSTGPHLHYEVLVNNRFVDPISIRVPRSRKLREKALQDYQRERTRIEALLRRSPVRTASR